MKNFYSNMLGILVACFCLLVTKANGQTISSPKQLFSSYIKPESSNQVLIMKDESSVTKQQMLSMMTSGGTSIVPPYLSFGLKDEKTDELGKTHSTYILKVNGVEVENGILKFHENGGKVLVASLPDLNVPNVGGAAINVSTAVANASSQVTKFSVTSKDNATLLPAQLLVSQLNGSHKLVWKVEAFGENILDRYFVYVDASNGTVLKKQSRKISCGGSVSVPTLYNGNQTIKYDYIPGNPSYNELLDNCGPITCGGTSSTSIETVFYSGGSLYYYSNPVGVSWPTTDVNYKTGYSAHWAMERSFDYYKCVHNRDSYDNAGHSILGITHGTLDNAFWDGYEMVFGDPSGGGSPFSGSLVSLDVTGHELTHAVTQYTANLTYEKESGALNEAWSDIFGTAIEYYVKGASGNFLIGEDVTYSGSLRSMANPNLRGQPDTYGGTYWVNVSGCTPDPNMNDNCGVHTNSGVANFWFYLLVNGGYGTNDLSNAYYVNPLGMSDASKIAYRALTTYFTPSTDFAAARTYTIHAAEDLFGICSSQAYEVANAWHAVGVGNNVPGSVLTCGTLYPANSGTLKALEHVVSGGGGCITTITTGTNMTFWAGKSVDIGPGFKVDAGAVFTAKANLCTPGQGVAVFKLAASSNGGANINNVNSQEPDINIENNISIYPNPTTGQFSLYSNTKGKVTILNSLGENVLEKQVNDREETRVDLSGKSKGIYFVNFISGSEVKTQKIIVE